MCDSGIYAIRSQIDGKIYVGSTGRYFFKRFSEHKDKLNSNKHCNPHLQRAWNKHGDDRFEFIILENVQDSSLLEIKEKEWVELLKSKNPEYGYNIADPIKGTLGLKFDSPSVETRLKMSKAKVGRNNYMYGRKHTEEAKEGMSINRKGFIFTKEHREKIRLSKIGKNNSFYGKRHSDETKKKISESKKGKTWKHIRLEEQPC